MAAKATESAGKQCPAAPDRKSCPCFHCGIVNPFILNRPVYLVLPSGFQGYLALESLPQLNHIPKPPVPPPIGS